MPVPSSPGAGVKVSMSSSIVLRPVSSSPLVIGMRPSAISTPVGYQRPCAMSGCSFHFSVHGLNV